MRGTDTDNYDGPIPENHFRLLKEQYGVDFNIIGLEAQMPFALDQKRNAEAAGIEVPLAYKFLYWQDNDLERMKQAAGFGLPIAIDCEYATGMANPEATVERIQQAKDLLISEGLYWGIYTGQWWWVPQTANSEAFKNDNLWHAGYPWGGGNLPPVEYRPNNFVVNYGGWVQSTIWQYADVCYGDELGPWALDLNAWNPAKRKEQPMPEPQPTEVEALRALVNAGAIIVSGVGNLEGLSAKDKSALKWIVETAK